MIGYNSLLKIYMAEEEGREFALTQTSERSEAHVLRVDLQEGSLANLTREFRNHCFQVSSVEDGVAVGTVTANSFNSFFWVKGGRVNVI